ncbi:uncharacterized protein BDR25DRAFT_77422 [Lindgomyces ingoldianus]|uniref:Uncharacterized protein n=1 Tax=Lindgomyces ingoldianus TaxID=673940 RepID=A0ACB6QHG3_9PLEO|nr:uncharacterized protein BDR25DRAFT_77422 [Lindgomyces ingoldianus]KAF2466316.1 hypothetical protein BDR25DRAFT_77422 [Lindgomyces ingoldianus]
MKHMIVLNMYEAIVRSPCAVVLWRTPSNQPPLRHIGTYEPPIVPIIIPHSETAMTRNHLCLSRFWPDKCHVYAALKPAPLLRSRNFFLHRYEEVPEDLIGKNGSDSACCMCRGRGRCGDMVWTYVGF